LKTPRKGEREEEGRRKGRSERWEGGREGEGRKKKN